MSLKVHIIVEYVAHFCEKYNSGLGLYSEQSLEYTNFLKIFLLIIFIIASKSN